MVLNRQEQNMNTHWLAYLPSWKVTAFPPGRMGEHWFQVASEAVSDAQLWSAKLCVCMTGLGRKRKTLCVVPKPAHQGRKECFLKPTVKICLSVTFPMLNSQFLQDRSELLQDGERPSEDPRSLHYLHIPAVLSSKQSQTSYLKASLCGLPGAAHFIHCTLGAISFARLLVLP